MSHGNVSVIPGMITTSGISAGVVVNTHKEGTRIGTVAEVVEVTFMTCSHASLQTKRGTVKVLYPRFSPYTPWVYHYDGHPRSSERV
jgi:hypothetical protein